MTNKNPYEEMFDIPDIVEDKDETTSTSVDMSIFKMSEEELYDDGETQTNVVDDTDETTTNYEEELYTTKPKKKSKAGIVFLIILLVILAAITTVSLIYALKFNKQVTETELSLQQTQAQVKDLENKNKELQTKANDLQATIDAMEKAKLLKNYEVIDGPISFRSSPNKDAEKITYEGEEFAYDGDVFKALEIVVDTLDPSYSWLKVADGVYFCIGTTDEPWVEAVED